MVLFIGPLYSGKHEAAKAYAEAAGRLSIRLAEQADEVYRVVCGIAKKLK